MEHDEKINEAKNNTALTKIPFLINFNIGLNFRFFVKRKLTKTDSYLLNYEIQAFLAIIDQL